MNKFSVAYCIDGIYAGIRNPTKDNGIVTWKTKTKCTEEAIGAVKQWMEKLAEENNQKTYRILWNDSNIGKTCTLTFEIGENEKGDDWNDIKESHPPQEDMYLVLIERPNLFAGLPDIKSFGEYQLAWFVPHEDGTYSFTTTNDEDVTKMVKFWTDVPEFNREY